MNSEILENLWNLYLWEESKYEENVEEITLDNLLIKLGIF